jgi:hypothetical protein
VDTTARDRFKARNPSFLAEVTPLLAPGIVYDARAALDLVQCEFIERLPWRRVEEPVT